jgi:hypothetical protein
MMKKVNKRGFMGQLSPLAIALVVFATVIVVGMVVISNLTASVSSCPAGYNWSQSANLCANNTAIGFGNTTGSGGAVNGVYLLGQMGSTSGGLASWAPAIIAIAIGVLVIGAISSIGSKKY